MKLSPGGRERAVGGKTVHGTRLDKFFRAHVKASGDKAASLWIAPAACLAAEGESHYFWDTMSAEPITALAEHPEQAYLDLLADILRDGVERADRTGVGTLGVFGRQMRFDLTQGFPLLTTKRVHFKSIVVELAWFLRGETNVRWLQERGCTIWDEWANAEGELGPVYGKQWRSWSAPDGRIVDQITGVVSSLKANPESRRHVVSAWNPADVADMALPPCHCLFQFHVAKGRLSCQLYQRSADVFLGVPFNIASYALLTHLIARETGHEVGDLVITLGDAHLYLNHLDQARLQLTRTPFPLPTVRVAPGANLFELEADDVSLEGYRAHPLIRAPIAV